MRLLLLRISTCVGLRLPLRKAIVDLSDQELRASAHRYTPPMPETTTAELPAEVSVEDQAPAWEPQLVEDEMLVEEISIDGMCGVY